LAHILVTNLLLSFLSYTITLKIGQHLAKLLGKKVDWLEHHVRFSTAKLKDKLPED